MPRSPHEERPISRESCQRGLSTKWASWTKTKKHHNHEWCARHLNLFHVYRAYSRASKLEIIVVNANNFVDSKIAVKDNAGWKPNVNRRKKCCECTAINPKIAEEFRGMKDHLWPLSMLGNGAHMEQYHDMAIMIMVFFLLKKRRYLTGSRIRKYLFTARHQG